MDLFKTCDCLPHDLMVTTLQAYGLARTKTGFIYSECPMSFAELLKALYWVLYFSIFLFITFLVLLKSQASVLLNMITLSISI